MPSDVERVAARMRTLVRELVAIADQAGITDDELITLEKTLSGLGSTGFQQRMELVAAAINKVASSLAAVSSPNRIAEITNLRRALFDLYDPAREGRFVSSLKDIQDPVERQRLSLQQRYSDRWRLLKEGALSFGVREQAGLGLGSITDQIGGRATVLSGNEQILIKEKEIVAARQAAIHASNEEWLAQRRIVYELQQAIIAEREKQRVSGRDRGALSARLGIDPAEAQRLRGQAFGAPGRAVPVTTDQQSIGQILQQYKGFIGTDVGVENLRKRMEALGITNAKVTSATEELSTGMRTFGFAIERQDGSVARATVRLDRFGNIMRETRTGFRTWSSAISSNLIKVVQWGIATGAVYGIMRGFRQVLREMIDIENELANVQIILGKGAGDLNTIFKEAAEVADLTSTSVKGVVEGYTLAYQAAGSFEDPTLRAAAANSLLQESMVLATLSGTDQAQAMDTLVGALRQTGSELTDGRELLDRWVAVSRESNVSLNTLAQTYSIVGATAQGLGLTFEELNALTATLAEATGLSATETGNAIRGIVAGFQSAQAEKVLDRFGIETRKATGELRNFWDLLNEVAFLLQSGAISPAELTEIANAIGGGYRRGAQVQTILEGMARAQQLVGVQMNASGEAADALETKMETLQAAITRMGNAFTNLAQTLGDEGGFLTVAKGVVETMTFFVDVIDRLVAGLGKATPALLAFGAAWLVLQSGQAQSILNRPATGLLAGGPALSSHILPWLQERRAPGTALLNQRLPGPPQPQRTIGGVLGGISSRTLSAAGIILPAAGTLAAAAGREGGAQAEDFEKAGAQIAGGIVGTLIAGPVGAFLGSAIGGAFADAVIDESREIGGRLAEHFAKKAEEDGVGEEDATVLNEELVKNLHPLVRAQADVASWIARAAEFVAPARGSKPFQAPEELFTSEDVLIGMLSGELGEGGLMSRLISDEDRQKFQELIAQTVLEGIEKGDLAGPFRTLVEEGIPEVESSAGDLVAAFIDEAQREFVLGDIDVTDMVGISDLSVEKIAPKISQLREALSLSGVDTPVRDLISSYLDLDDASKQLLDDASRTVVSLADQVDYLKNNEAAAGQLEETTRKLSAALQYMSDLQNAITQRQILAGVQERPIVDVGRLTPQQIQRVRTEADRLRDQAARAYADGSEEGAELWVEALGNVLIRAGEGIGKQFIDEFFDQDPEYIKAAIENLGYEDALKEVTQFGLRDLRDQLGVADFPSLMRRYEQVKGTITSVFPEYDVQEEGMGLILKDGFRTIHADQTLLNLAMQDLIDVNEQQLEGVWNLPSGMTAFVAWSSLFSRDVGGGGGQVNWDELFAGGAGGATGTPGAFGGTVVDRTAMQAELQRLQDLIVRTSQRMQDPMADQATIEQGQYYLDQLVQQYRELASRIEAVGVTGVAQVGGDGAVGGIQEPLTAETIAQVFADVFQLENRIELNANIRLTVDGRTLANVVKQYLFEDLVQATDRSIGGGGGYVIEGQ